MIIVLTACANGFVHAADAQPAMKAGSKGLLFSFSGLYTFTPRGLFVVKVTDPTYQNAFYGAMSGVTSTFVPTSVPGVGVRYYLTDQMALRGGLGIGFISQSEKNPSGSASNPLSDNTVSGMLIGVQGIAELRMKNVGPISPYVGAGLGLQLASVSATTHSSATSSLDSKASATTFKLLLCGGFEWFYEDNISFGAEYQLGLGMLSGSTTRSPSGGSSTTTDLPSGTTIGTNAFSLVLSMYP